MSTDCYPQETSQLLGQAPNGPKTVQQYVKGEMSSASHGSLLVGYTAGGHEEPETPVHTTEPSLTDKTELAEELQKSEVAATLKPEQQDYSAEWDPQQ